MKVCVNISAQELLTPALHQYVAETLRETEMEAADLRLEVNESSLLQDAREVTLALERLKSLGVKLALDNFGRGYAALTLLKSLPVDVVKIDRSLVARLGGDVESQSMVAAIVNLAHALELEVVGEGVENSRQLACLSRLGCDMVQGHYLARAVPPGKVPEAARLIDYYFNAS